MNSELIAVVVWLILMVFIFASMDSYRGLSLEYSSIEVAAVLCESAGSSLDTLTVHYSTADSTATCHNGARFDVIVEGIR